MKREHCRCKFLLLTLPMYWWPCVSGPLNFAPGHQGLPYILYPFGDFFSNSRQSRTGTPEEASGLGTAHSLRVDVTGRRVALHWSTETATQMPMFASSARRSRLALKSTIAGDPRVVWFLSWVVADNWRRIVYW